MANTKRQMQSRDQFVARVKDALWAMANIGSENPLCSVVKVEVDKRANELLIEALLIKRENMPVLRRQVYELEQLAESAWTEERKAREDG